MKGQLPPDQELKIEMLEIINAALVFRSINNELRRRILQLIHKKQKITVTEIYKKLRLEQSVASQHLGILRKARLVNTERDSKFIYYSVNYKALDELEATAKALLNYEEPKEQVVEKANPAPKKETQYRPKENKPFVDGKKSNRPLSEKMKKIICMICEEQNNRDIAKELGLTTRAVESLRVDIMERTGVINIAGLVVYAIKHEIYKIPEE